MEPKYKMKGFMARSLALYNAARVAARATDNDVESPIEPIQGITAVRRAQPAQARGYEDRDINALS